MSFISPSFTFMAHQEHSVPSTHKDGERKCKACNLIFPDIYTYTDHLESKEHTSGVMKKKYGKKYLEAKAKLSGQIPEKDKNNSSEDSSSDDEGEVYKCEICEKLCTGLINYKLHLSGKKHEKNVKKSKLLKQMKSDKIIPEDANIFESNPLMDAIFTHNQFSSSEILCKVCNKKCTGPESYKAHRNSESHKKKLATQNLLKELEDTNEDDENSDVEVPTAFTRCDICCKGFSGPLPYKQHILSASHLKQIKQAKEMNKMKDLIRSEDGNKIQCKECNKYFTGPKPFQDHLNSASHMKLKKKKDLIKSLQEKYSDMVIRSDFESNNSDDIGCIISCKICHRAFSGPESAKEHFISKNHKKAKKEERRIEGLKILENDGNQKPKASNSNCTDHTKKSGGDSDSSSTDSFQIISTDG